MNTYDNPTLSVDVLAVRYTDRTIQVGVAPRLNEPHIHELALPGVLMTAGETVTQAARRALTSKLGIPNHTITLVVYGKIFDTPPRDHRGPTISIGCIAIIHSDVDHQSDPRTYHADWFTFDKLPDLPFDHNRIVTRLREWLSELIWTNPSVLRAIVGDTFPTPTMITLDTVLRDAPTTRSSVHYRLRTIPMVHRVPGPITGRGRPKDYWRVS